MDSHTGEGTAADLRGAIERSDLDAVKKTIDQLTTKQVRQELDNVIDGENSISYALRLGHRKIAIELLIRSIVENSRWCYTYEEFSWFKLFELVPRQAPIKRYTQILKYVAPFAVLGDIDLETLADRAKFLKVAIELGARPIDEKRLGERILQSKMPHANCLFTWLVEKKICTKFPLTVHETFKRLLSGHKFLIESLRQYPDYILGLDREARSGRSAKRVTHHKRVWSSILKAEKHTENWIAAAMQRNKDGEIPALLYFRNYDKASVCPFFVEYPPEFSEALKRLIEAGQTEALQQFCARQTEKRTRLTLAIFYLYLQHLGFESEDLQCKIQAETGLVDSHTLLPNRKLPKKEIPTVQNEQKSESSLGIPDLPKELIQIICASLDMHELVKLSVCCKSMAELLKNLLNSGESFWRSYYETHFYPIKPNTTYRNIFQQNIKQQSNWHRNQYSTIEFDECKPLSVDENWFVAERNENFCFWNCQTQKWHATSTRVSTDRLHALLNTYNKVDGYAILLASRDMLTVLRGSGEISLGRFPGANWHFGFSELIPIDHRVLFNSFPRSALYDVEQCAIIYQFPGILSRERFYNPYDGTFYGRVMNSVNHFQITDLRTKSVTDAHVKGRRVSPEGSAHYQFVDEHTFFYDDYLDRNKQHRTESGFVDTRTFKAIVNVNNITPRQKRVYCHDRAIFKDQDLPLLCSWNLMTHKIEWIEHIGGRSEDLSPSMANSRYFFATDGCDGTICRDYL